MRIVAWKRLRDFAALHPDAAGPLAAWFAEVESATWTTPADIKARYASASFVANNRVVFNIRGNNYRVIVVVHYNSGFVYVRFVGTHADYDRIDAKTV